MLELSSSVSRSPHRGSTWVTLLGLSAVLLGCGEAPPVQPTDHAAAPIVDGYVDDVTKGAIGLGVNFFGNFFGHCSGTLIAPNLVLTARHCVALTQGEAPGGGVVCGQTGFGFQGGGELFRVTAETVRPLADGPQFYKGTGQVRVAPGANDICGYDVALIILEGAGMPADVAKPVIPRIDSTPAAGEKYSAIGYGLTDPNDQNSSGTRMRVDDNIVACAGNGCMNPFMVQVRESEWQGNGHTCPGDSGGPAVDELGRVTGVLSRGPQGCVSSVYGNVGAWKDFIIETAKEAAELGGYEPAAWVVTGNSEAGKAGELSPCGDGVAECSSVLTCYDKPDGSGGQCVSSCSEADPTCPATTRCDVNLELCVPTAGELEPCGDGALQCADGLGCFATSGGTGTCVPGCSAASNSCPATTSCDANIGYCVPEAAKNPDEGGDGGGCGVASRGPGKPVPWFIGVAAAMLFFLRRRHG